MTQLISKLKELLDDVPIDKNFDWNFPDAPIQIPSDINDTYSKNIYLKENFAPLLKNDIGLRNHYWIIQEWGGIKSLKKNDRNDEKIRKFKQQLLKQKMTKETFSLISSFSKIASFLEPQKYAIYDSRAIYSLNWLLFNYTDKKMLYPQPAGRNPKLSQYNLGTIFRLSKQKHSFISYKDAYFHYCDLLNELSKEIFNESKPYKIEMLLFLIAPTKIIDSIESQVKIIVDANV